LVGKWGDRSRHLDDVRRSLVADLGGAGGALTAESRSAVSAGEGVTGAGGVHDPVDGDCRDVRDGAAGSYIRTVRACPEHDKVV
jgi:hypothetical protein